MKIIKETTTKLTERYFSKYFRYKFDNGQECFLDRFRHKSFWYNDESSDLFNDIDIENMELTKIPISQINKHDNLLIFFEYNEMIPDKQYWSYYYQNPEDGERYSNLTGKVKICATRDEAYDNFWSNISQLGKTYDVYALNEVPFKWSFHEVRDKKTNIITYIDAKVNIVYPVQKQSGYYMKYNDFTEFSDVVQFEKRFDNERGGRWRYVEIKNLPLKWWKEHAVEAYLIGDVDPNNRKELQKSRHEAKLNGVYRDTDINHRRYMNHHLPKDASGYHYDPDKYIKILSNLDTNFKRFERPIKKLIAMLDNLYPYMKGIQYDFDSTFRLQMSYSNESPYESLYRSIDHLLSLMVKSMNVGISPNGDIDSSIIYEFAKKFKTEYKPLIDKYTKEYNELMNKTLKNQE